MNAPHTAKDHYGKIVLSFFLAGAFFLLLFTVGLFGCADETAGHYFQPHLLALTHVIMPGFATMIIFGALCQFLPVIAEKKLYSSRLALWTCILLCAGTLLLAYAFWNFSTGLVIQIASLLVFSAVLLQTINIFKTVAGARSTIILECITTAHLWLLITVIIGVLLAFNFQFLFLPKDQLHYLALHAHLGLAGWMLLLIIGVASKLFPMFLLSTGDHSKFTRFSYYAINISLVLFFADVLLTHTYDRAFFYVTGVCAGIGAFAVVLVRVKKNAARKKTEGQMKQAFFAFLFLAVPLAVMLIRFFPANIFSEDQLVRLSGIYGIAIIAGFFVMLILGFTFKTLPFILWLEIKKERKTPPGFLPRDMYSAVTARSVFWMWDTGIIIFLAGNVFRVLLLAYAGAGLMFFAALLFQWCILSMAGKQSQFGKK